LSFRIDRNVSAAFNFSQFVDDCPVDNAMFDHSCLNLGGTTLMEPPVESSSSTEEEETEFD
jgi:hypothetical protein